MTPPASPQQSPFDMFTITREQLETLQDYVGENFCRVNRTIAFHTIKDIYDAGCTSNSANTDARERVEKVIKELEARKINEHPYGEESAFNDGIEEAIALLKDRVERE